MVPGGHPGGTRWTLVVLGGPWWTLMVIGGPRWSLVDPGGPRWTLVGPSGPWWSLVVLPARNLSHHVDAVLIRKSTEVCDDGGYDHLMKSTTTPQRRSQELSITVSVHGVWLWCPLLGA